MTEGSLMSTPLVPEARCLITEIIYASRARRGHSQEIWKRKPRLFPKGEVLPVVGFSRQPENPTFTLDEHFQAGLAGRMGPIDNYMFYETIMNIVTLLQHCMQRCNEAAVQQTPSVSVGSNIAYNVVIM